MHSGVRVEVDGSGAAEMILFREWRNWQYEQYASLLSMDGKERKEALLRMLKVPQTEIQIFNLHDDGASLAVDAGISCQRYATVTGQRLFLPVSPFRYNYSAPSSASNRQEDVWIEMGYADDDDITLVIPDGYAIEALPRAVTLQQPFGEFCFQHPSRRARSPHQEPCADQGRQLRQVALSRPFGIRQGRRQRILPEDSN